MSRKLKEYMFKFFIYASAALTVSILFFITFYIAINGGTSLNFEFLKNILPMFLNTIFAVILTLVFVVPIGLATAIYLQEYAKPSISTKIITFATDCLAGTPSIIMGLFGLLFFVKLLGFGFSMLAGCLTLSMLVLPTIIRGIEEALKTVPTSYREGSFALGATKIQTIFKVILPSCFPGILVSIILATGRIIGETAALIFTAGTALQLSESLFSSGRTLAIHMFLLVKEGLDISEAYATALLLLMLTLALNAIANIISWRLNKIV